MYLPEIRGKQATNLAPRKPQVRHVEETEYSRGATPVKGPKRFEGEKFGPLQHAPSWWQRVAKIFRDFPLRSTLVAGSPLPERGVKSRRKPCLRYPNPYFSSGDDRTRTDDPRVANAMLSQLSYVPPRGRAIGSHRPHAMFVTFCL